MTPFSNLQKGCHQHHTHIPIVQWKRKRKTITMIPKLAWDKLSLHWIKLRYERESYQILAISIPWGKRPPLHHQTIFHHVQKVCSLTVNHFNYFYYLEVSRKIVYLLFLKSRIKAFTLSFLSLSIASLTAAEGSHFEIKLVSLQRIKSFWPVPKLQLKKKYNTIIYTKSITRDYWSYNCFHCCLASWIIFCWSLGWIEAYM